MPLDDRRALEERVRALEAEVGGLRAARVVVRGVRRRASFSILGLPAWDVALGPAPDGSALRGHARGFIAVGDVATGVIALGGVARGLFAFGGIALGGITFGGISLGLLLALGGLALGGVALGGGAVGGLAVGGAAGGWYASGGAAIGAHVVSAGRRDPEAVELFEQLGLGPPASGRMR